MCRQFCPDESRVAKGRPIAAVPSRPSKVGGQKGRGGRYRGTFAEEVADKDGRGMVGIRKDGKLWVDLCVNTGGVKDHHDAEGYGNSNGINYLSGNRELGGIEYGALGRG